MALFGNKDGGFMDVIRCDEPDYLIWKWHPKGTNSQDSQRANAIRFGSSLRVKEGSVAVFVYSQADGVVEDFIEGPYDQIIETNNFPVLSTLVGTLYQGDSPFQAEIYFINLANLIQVQFGVPYFDVFDSAHKKIGGVPVAVRGSINFKIGDYHEFIKLHRLEEFGIEKFREQIRTAVIYKVKDIVGNYPTKNALPVIELERRIADITESVQEGVKEAFSEEYGVDVTKVYISDIELDKNSEGYKKYMKATNNVATDIVSGAASVFDAISTQALASKRLKQSRENEGLAEDEKKSDIGQKVSSTIGSVLGGLKKNNKPTPPPIPTAGYYLAVEGKQKGPYDISKFKEMAAKGTFDKDSLVWKDGMENWVRAGDIEDMAVIFEGSTPPPIPM